MKIHLLICSLILMTLAGCRQRAPQDGMTSTIEKDGSKTETSYENGRMIKQVSYSSSGMKQSEMFYFFQTSGMNSIYHQQSPDKESVVVYGSKGQIVTNLIRQRSDDGASMLVIGKRYTDDGKLITVEDSTGLRIFYTNGQVQLEKKVIGEKRERQTYYDTAGTKREEWETLNGLRHGIRREYNAQGKMTVNELYDNGNRVQK